MKKFINLRNLGALAVAGATLAMTLTLTSETASAAPLKGPRSCRASDVTFYQNGQSSGNDTGSSLFIEAKRGKSCYLKGYITRVNFRDAKGHSMGLNTAKNTSQPEARIPVSEGRETGNAAEIDFSWKSQGSSAGVVTPHSLSFRLPDAKHDSKVPWQNGPISVNHPFTYTAVIPVGN